MNKNTRYSGSIGIMTVFMLFSSLLTAQHPDSTVTGDLGFKLNAYYEWYPQQKVYLHLDKYKYNADERVWFKAYVVNATSHRPDSLSTNLYVDLISPGGYIVQTRLLRLEEGLANGDFAFQDTVPEGNYRIRAYTNWMKNAGKEFFYSREIYVANPEFKTYATREEVKAVKRSHRQNSRHTIKFDISFLPEGGNMLNGVENRIAFKAINVLGHSVEITGKLIDQKGNHVLDFSSVHDGMGAFRFTPVSGNRYTAVVSSSGSKEQRFKLPEGIDKGIVLSADYAGMDSIKVSIVTNLGPGNMPPNTRYYLLAQTRGVPEWSSTFDLSGTDRSMYIPKSVLPTGITQLTLFNSRPVPVSERLVFVNHQDQLHVSILPLTTSAPEREKVQAKIRVTDDRGIPVDGSFSLAVAREDEAAGTGDITSNLLLSSDIRGNVEDPDFYFTGWNEHKEKLLDYVMMTNGWRRFDWYTVLLNQKEPVKYPIEDGIEITGKITREFFKLPLRDIKVTLTILNQYNDQFTKRSAKDGSFAFTGLVYPDTVGVKIQAAKDNGKKNLVIHIDQRETSRIEDMNYVTMQHLRKPGPEGKYQMPEEEVEEDPFAEENNRIYRIHSEPGKQDVIIVDESMQHFQNVAQIIQGRVPGVLVSGNNVTIRGISSIYGSNDPLFLVDGVVVDKNYALSMSPYDVARIEILKGPNAAIYGSRGANGVIAIYTRRGKFMIKGVLTFEMLGYYTPRTYYSPRYDLRRDEALEDDRTTIYWAPFITTGPDGEAEVSFYTSDIGGTYTLDLQGLSPNGKTGSGSASIEVK